MKWMLVSMSFGVLSACKVAPIDDTADQCTALCGAELQLDISTEGESFQIQLYGEEFNTLNLACPDGIRAGGPAQVQSACVEGGVLFSAVDYRFPETLMYSLDMGPEQTLSPAWEEVELCGTFCNQASAEIGP